MDEAVSAGMIDILRPSRVEIQIRSDGRVVWVNIDGICRLRIMAHQVDIIDERQLVSPPEL